MRRKEQSVQDESEIAGLDVMEGRIGYAFQERGLVERALTHKSYANENAGGGEDNQRLEFLGDAVLGLVVAETLMERLPEATEGQLTRRRAALVNETVLGDLAREADLGPLLRLGVGEEKNNGRERTSILADAVEAVVGAVYLDGGYQQVRGVILRWLGARVEEVVDADPPGDAKTDLQEALQARVPASPTYSVVSEEGPDHDKVFEVAITVGETVLALGRGRSKKEAEKDAARRALEAMEEE